MKNNLRIAQNTPMNLTALLLLVTGIFALQFIFPEMHDLYEIGNQRISNTWLNLRPISTNWLVLSAIPFVLINLLIIYHINSHFIIIRDANYLPAWIYVLVSFYDYRFLHLSAELISSTFIEMN